MANIVNQYGQVKVGVRTQLTPPPSSLWTSLYSVYNADSIGSSSLKTSLFAAYNGESNANDSFGSNNGTAVGGLTYTTGKIGNAFSFNGTNAYVSLPNSSGQFNFDGDFSVSMWFRSSNLSTSRYAIGNYKSGGAYGYGWQVYYSLAGGFAFDLRNGNIINQVRKIQTINTNTWYHVVAVRKMGQIHKLYVNGIDTLAPQTDGNVNNIAGYTANQPMNLGGLPDINLPALCDLDGVNMWNRVLTASEVSELYNSGNGAQYITDNFYKPTTNDALNTYNGTAQGGLTYGVGKVGTAFQFNGTNAYVSLPNTSGQFNFTGDFSVSMWFKSSNLSASRYAIGNYKSGGTYGYGWILHYSQGGNGFTFSVRNGSVINEVGKSQIMSINTWYHVVAVRKMGQIHKLYVNGVDVLANQQDGNVNNIATYTANQPMNLGGLSDANAPALCDLDGVNMWNRALTASEITELYNSGNGKQYPF